MTTPAPTYEYLTDSLQEAELALAAVGRKIQELRLHGKKAEADTIAEALPEVQVYAYVADKAYGGAEEGGWWYDTEQVIERSPVIQENLRMRLDKAQAWVAHANDLADVLINCDRRSPNSVLSEGHIRYQWTLGQPMNRPLQRPHYE